LFHIIDSEGDSDTLPYQILAPQSSDQLIIPLEAWTINGIDILKQAGISSSYGSISKLKYLMQPSRNLILILTTDRCAWRWALDVAWERRRRRCATPTTGQQRNYENDSHQGERSDPEQYEPTTILSMGRLTWLLCDPHLLLLGKGRMVGDWRSTYNRQ
jgi:hypothetical protein